MTARTCSRAGLMALLAGIVAIVAIRVLHPYFITPEKLSSADSIRAHMNKWLMLGASVLGIALAGLIVWIVAGILSIRKPKDLAEHDQCT